MVALGHTGVGTLVGLATFQLAHQNNVPILPTIILAFSFGIISHYLADMIPHGHFFSNDLKRNLPKVFVFDLFGPFFIIAGVAFYNFGFDGQFLTILAGVLGAQMPDVLDGLIAIGIIKLKGILNHEFFLHQDIAHWHGKGDNGLPWRKRDIWQFLIYFTSLALLLRT